MRNLKAVASNLISNTVHAQFKSSRKQFNINRSGSTEKPSS